MNRIPVYFGLICGIVLIAWVRGLDASRLIYTSQLGLILGYLSILILPTCLFLAFRAWKRQSGQLLFRQAMFIGLSLAMITAGVYCAYTFIDIHYFGASHLQNQFDFTRKSMQAAGSGTTEISAEIARLQKHYFSSKPYISTLIWYAGMGLVFSPIFWFFLRNKKMQHA